MHRNPPPGNRRILVVDDNAAIHRDFAKILSGRPDDDVEASIETIEAVILGESLRPRQPTLELSFALQGEQGAGMAEVAAREGRSYAMAFVDMRMPPGWDGLKTIKRLWQVDPNIQVVICSAHSDYDWSEVVERLGRRDSLLVLRKPFEPIEAQQCASALCRKWHNERATRGHVESLEQVVANRTQGLEAANRQLRHLATHDALTGLPNRVLLEDRLQQAMARADRDGQLFALLVCDLDRFKLVNDSLGHRAGDALLQEVARRLLGVVRSVDTVARIGGDEFVLVLSPLTDRTEAEAATQRVLDGFQSPVTLDGVEVHTSPSVGIAFYPADGATVEELIAHADAAMYVAKQRGRNQAQCFVANMGDGTRDRIRFESDLHRALELGQFELHYQPKVDTATGAVRSAEALIRWHHPELGIVSPTEFIPVAEENGLIGAIGEWVLREACRQARAWQQQGFPSIRVAVNLSANQFRNGTLVDAIRGALTAAELDPRYLEVELTESAVMTYPEESIGVLEQLSAMGILVSVDDFGTGYSSMSYLRRFPIDKLKIDRAFINEVTARTDDASIVQAIVSLAHSLKLKVVAEGVETAEQLEFLKSLGCDQYQGYYFSRPLTADAFEQLLRENERRDAPISDGDADPTYSKLAVLKF